MSFDSFLGGVAGKSLCASLLEKYLPNPALNKKNQKIMQDYFLLPFLPPSSPSALDNNEPLLIFLPTFKR